jgi:hypothetical protein
MSAEPAPAAQGSFGTWTIRALALIGLLGCLALVALVVMVAGVSMQRREPARVETGDTHQIFSVGNVDAIPRTSLVRMDVRADRGSDDPYSSGGREDRRNIILLDTATGTSRRLRPNNNRRIADFGLLPGDERSTEFEVMADSAAPGDANKAKAKPVWYYMLLDRADDTGIDLVLGSLASTQQATVLTAIDGVDSRWMLDATHLALIVREKRKLSYRVIDLTSFKVTSARAIAID